MKIFGKEQRGKWWLAAPNYDPLQKHGGRKHTKKVSVLGLELGFFGLKGEV